MASLTARTETRRIVVPLARVAMAMVIGASTCAVAADVARPANQKTGTIHEPDRDMEAVLDALQQQNGKPIETLTPAEARQQPTPPDAVKAVLEQQGRDASPTALVPGVSSQDTTVPGSASALPVRVYTLAGAGPFPVIVYLHCGGWVIADKEVYDGGARGLAKAANAIVVSVDYRRAPEAKFPAAWDDACAAYKYVAANAQTTNGNPAKLALAGEGAGGNLAVATAIAARNGGTTMPKYVVAVYPVAQTGDMATESYRDSVVARPLDKATIGWFVDELLAKSSDKTDPRLDLVNADLKGLPPMLIINAQIDPLRTDGFLLTEALQRAKVPVEHKVHTGVTHEFFGTAAVVAKAMDAQQLAGTRLKAAFAN